MKSNEDKIKAAGIRMALKMLPKDIMDAAPRHLETALTERLQKESPCQGEAGICYLLTPDDGGHIKVLLVGMDEQNTVTRVVAASDLAEIFTTMLDNLKNI